MSKNNCGNMLGYYRSTKIETKISIYLLSLLKRSTVRVAGFKGEFTGDLSPEELDLNPWLWLCLSCNGISGSLCSIKVKICKLSKL